MWNKLLIGGITAGALIAFAPHIAHAQSDCALVSTVADVAGDGFSCQLGDKVFSNFEFDDFILGQADDAAFLIDVEVLPGGDVFSAGLGELVGEQDRTFAWSYTVEITDESVAEGTQFQSVGLTHEVGAFGPDVTSTKTYQLFNDDDVQIGGDNTLTVSGADDTTDQSPVPNGITRIDVQDEVSVGAGGIFNGATNEFQQEEVVDMPMPATLALFSVGLLGLGYGGRRKRS